jgi:hypothetical protein
MKPFAKCLAHDGTLKRCVPLMLKVHTLLSCVKTCLKFNLYIVLHVRFQYSDLEAPECLPYPVVRPSARSRGHLRKVQYGDLEAPGCLPYPVARPSARFRDHLRT